MVVKKHKELCFRSGSSLLGDLLSLHRSLSYYFELFFQHKIFGKCKHRFNSLDVVNLIEETVGGIVNCEGKVINNLCKFSIRRRERMSLKFAKKCLKHEKMSDMFPLSVNQSTVRVRNSIYRKIQEICNSFYPKKAK